MIVPALSVRQPWASLIDHGAKTIETRRWYTRYRGPLVICSSRRPADQGPTGMALCIVSMMACRPMTVEDEPAARCRLYEGAFAWCFRQVWGLRSFAVRGQLGIFDLDVPERAFLTPEHRHEVQKLVVWSKERQKPKGLIL